MNPFEKDWNKAESKTTATPGAYADITIVLDRSASMVSLQNGVIEGINKQVDELRKKNGGNYWTLIQFDDPISARAAGEEFPYTSYSKVRESEIPYLSLGNPVDMTRGLQNAAKLPWNPPAEPPNFTIPPNTPICHFVPRGNTALVDALCDVIDKTELRTSGMDHVKVAIGIFTDGEENASSRFNSNDLRERIARTQSKKGWDYLYFGANQDSFRQTRQIGIGGAMTSGLLNQGASYTNNYQNTCIGMSQAIMSGSIGLMEIASGAVCSGRIAGGHLNFCDKPAIVGGN